MMTTPASKFTDRITSRCAKAGPASVQFVKYLIGISLVSGQIMGSFPAAQAQTPPAVPPASAGVATPAPASSPAPASTPAPAGQAASAPPAKPDSLPAAQPSSPGVSAPAVPANPPPPIVPPPGLPALVAPAVPVSPGAPGVPPAQLPEPDASTTMTIDVKPRAVLMIRGASNWDDGYKAISDALGKLRAAVIKAGLKESGRPLTSFIDTDDNGFKFEAMIPIESAPEGKVDLGPEAKLGISPSGKALKFQHRGAYDDIDSTYEAITAYLDEKGLDAQNVFVEEYLNDPKGAEDTSSALDIYVFIK